MPDFNAVEVQAVFSGPINTVLSVVGSAPPLVPGDLLTGITVYYGSGTTEPANPANLLLLEVYGCNSQPKSVAEAQNGRKLLDVELPFKFDVVNTTLIEGQFTINVTIPFFHRFELGEQYLSIVASSSEVDASGAFFARLSRTIDD